jgi:hypothetical protein
MKYGIIGLTIFLTSCAALGSRTKVYDEAKARSIKTVGLITKQYKQPRSPYHKIIKEAFTRALIAKLERENLFNVVILDTLENEGLNIQTYATQAPVDVLLVAEWRLINPFFMDTDSRVELSLVDKVTREVVLVSRHGTKLGNTYRQTPFLPATLLDATEGAVNSMAKKLKGKQE